MPGCGAEQTDIIGKVQRAHQIGDKPIGRRDTLRRVFDGDDGMEAFADASDAAFFRESFQGFADGSGGSGQRGLYFRTIKAVKAALLEIIKEVRNSFVIGHGVLMNAKRDGSGPFFN